MTSVAPAPYIRLTSFSGQSPYRDSSLGVSIDNEFNAVQVAINAIENRLSLIQRADGLLQNGSVGNDQLASGGLVFPSTTQLLTFGINAINTLPNVVTVGGASVLLTSGGLSGPNTDFEMNISKGAASNNASIVFQDNLVDRAEIGLVGDDNLHFRVSADGATFVDAFDISTAGVISGTGITALFASPPALGGTAPAAGAFTTLSASGAVSGAGITSLFASPPALGGTTPAAGAFTTLSASGSVSGAGFNAFMTAGLISGQPGAFTTLSASGSVSGTGFTAFMTAGLISGQPGAFTTLSASGAVSGTGITSLFASPPAIGGTAPGSVAATTLSASGAVSGAGITSLFASPPALGSTAPGSVAATTLTASGASTLSGAVTFGAGVTFTPDVAPAHPVLNALGVVAYSPIWDVYAYGAVGRTSAVTVTSATPAVVTWTAHGFKNGQPIIFWATTSIPTGVTAGITYYVIATGLTANTFQFSATLNGSAVNTTTTGTGVQCVTDDTVPIQAAATAAVLGSAGGQVHLPNGVFGLTTAITINVPAGRTVTVTGTGAETTTIEVFGAINGFTVNYGDQYSGFRCRNMCFTTNSANLATGINLVQAAAIANPAYVPASVFEHIIFRGITSYQDASNYFVNCMFVNNVSNVNIIDCFFAGTLTTPHGSGIAVQGKSGSSTYAVVLNVTDSFFTNLATGVTLFGWTQGFSASQCNFTGCGAGIAIPVSQGGGYSQMLITCCQFTCPGGVAINIATTINCFAITNNLFILLTASSIGLSVCGVGGVVCGNTFIGLSLTSTIGAQVVVGTGTVANDVCMLTGNNFYNMAFGIAIQSGAKANVGPNGYSLCTNTLLDSSGTAGLLQALDFSGASRTLTLNRTMAITPVTRVTLPASPINGQIAYVHDTAITAPAWHVALATGAVTGDGIVYYDGTAAAWKWA